MDEFGVVIVLEIIFILVYLFILFCTPIGKKIRRKAKEQRENIKNDYEFEKHIKEYKNFMKATGKNTLRDIALEFNENIFEVEKNIRRAIRINLLRGYYLCNQTGEILPIYSNPFVPRKSITIKENKSIKIKE